MGVETPPQMASRGGLQRTAMTRASRIADPIDIGKVAKPPPVRLPNPMTVFACRAERFADLAAGNPMADFLSFMAEIARASDSARRAGGRHPSRDMLDLGHATIRPKQIAAGPVLASSACGHSGSARRSGA